MAATHPWLPFFIEWDDPATFPGATASPPATVARLDVEGDSKELCAWLGEHELPLDVRAGTRGLTRLELAAPGGAIVLGS